MKIRDTRTKKEFTVPDGTLIPYFFEVVGEDKKTDKADTAKTDEASTDTAKETEKTDETSKKSEDKKTDK